MSLDFHSLLKQEKALRRSELAAESEQRQSSEAVQSCATTTKPPSSSSAASAVNDGIAVAKAHVASGFSTSEEKPPVPYFAELAARPAIDMEKARFYKYHEYLATTAVPKFVHVSR